MREILLLGDRFQQGSFVWDSINVNKVADLFGLACN